MMNLTRTLNQVCHLHSRLISATSLLLVSLCFILSSCEQQSQRKARPLSDKDEPNKNVELNEKVLDSLATIMQKPVEDDSTTEAIVKEKEFINHLTKALQDHNTFNYQYPELKKHNINIIKSDDNCLRIFTWQSAYSGSMCIMQNIIQYKNSQGQIMVESFNNLYKHKNDFAPTPAIQKAYHLKSTEGQNYLLLGNGQMSGTEPYVVAHVLNVKSGKFNINGNKFIINGKPEDELFIGITIKTDDDWDKVKNNLAIRYNPKDSIMIIPAIKEKQGDAYLTGRNDHMKYQNEMFKSVVI